MNVYNIEYKNEKHVLQKVDSKGNYKNISKPFDSFVEAEKYARKKVMNNKEDILLTDIPF